MRKKSVPAAKRPSRPSLAERALQSPLIGDGADAHDATKPDVEGFLREFEANLREQSDLSERDRDAIQREFAEALRAAARDHEDGKPAEPSDWAETIRLLEQDGVLDNSQSSDLVRQLEAAMQPLQAPDVQLAIEFGRRCREDGKDKALAWYRSQTQPSTDQAQPVMHDRDRPRPATSEVKSRARRVRGPPIG